MIGIPDDVAGEVPVAIIKRTDTMRFSRQSLQELAFRELGAIYSPKIILDLTDDLELQHFPTTASGKVRKAELREITVSFLQRHDVAINQREADSILSVLVLIWSRITGLNKENLPLDRSVSTFADSIMMLQFSWIVKKELGKMITYKVLDDHDTIEEQARLIESYPTVPVDEKRKPVREGPPDTGDMVHTFGDQIRTKRTRDAVEPILRKMNLSWENHVEDVIPMSDFSRFLVRPLRLQSWNHRQAFVATNASCAELNMP